MKKVLFCALVAATALFSACGGGKHESTPTGNLKDEVDSLSYAVGLSQSPTPEQIKDYLMQAGSDSAFCRCILQRYERRYEHCRR